MNRIRCFSQEATQKSREIIGVWIFHRHGDRTPAKPLAEDSYRDQEAAFWHTKVPPVDRTHYEMMSERFPATIHPENNGGNFLDAVSGSEPYGFLTWKGMQQLFVRGRIVGKRYKPENNEPLIDHWDIQAYSTNYLRTVKSLQCFLDGMFSVEQDLMGRDEKCSSYEFVDPETYLQPSHIPMVDIVVRDPKRETLNKFDSSPALMRQLVRNVVETPEFVERDARAAPLAARLSNYIPGLARFRSPHGSPSTINWIHAADHFICRSAHHVPLNAFSHLENCQVTEQTLQAMKHATIAHLASRFRLWYKSPPLLAEMMQPLLTDLCDEMNYVANNVTSDKGARKPFVIYSCHDVTILALLYSIEAAFLSSSEELKHHGISAIRAFERLYYWPEYACTLTIELSKVQTIEMNDEYAIKFLLNDEVVETIPSLRKQEDTITLDDFCTLVMSMQQFRNSNPSSDRS